MLHTARAKRLTLCAMLVALSVGIGTVCKLYLTFGAIRITFENLTILLAAYIFGPVYGAAAGVLSDLVTCLTSGQALNPLITVGAGCVGLTAGLFARLTQGKATLPRLAATVIPAHAVGNMLIKSIALHLYFSFPIELVALRIPLYLAIGGCECALLWLILRNPQIQRQIQNLR